MQWKRPGARVAISNIGCSKSRVLHPDMSQIHSPSGADTEGTAWEPDTDYEDYSWHLARTDGGEWKLLTWGYA